MIQGIGAQSSQAFPPAGNRHVDEDHHPATRGQRAGPSTAVELSEGVRDRAHGGGRDAALSQADIFKAFGRAINDLLRNVSDAFAVNREATAPQQSPPATGVDDTDDEVADGAVVGDDDALANRGMAFKALNGMGRDLRHLLREFGFGGKFAANLAHAFAKGAKEAVKQGFDFAAEITIAAARQVTSITDDGVRQSLSLVARQLSVEVNHDNGAVNISMASLAVESDVSLFTSAAPEDEGMDDAPADGTTDEAVGEPVADLSPASQPQLPAEPASATSDGHVAQLLAEFETQFLIQSVERFRNGDGEAITRLLLDAAIRISQPAGEDVPAQVPAQQTIATV